MTTPTPHHTTPQKLRDFTRGLDYKTKEALKDNLLKRKKELEAKGFTVEKRVRASPVVQALISQAVDEVKNAQQAHIDAIEKNILDHFGGDQEAFLRGKSEIRISMDMKNVHQIVEQMYNKVKRLTVEIQDGWPNKLNTAKDNRREIIAALENLSILTTGVIDSTQQQMTLLNNIKVGTSAGGASGQEALFIAALNASIDSSEAIIDELQANIVGPLMESITTVRNKRIFYKGKVLDKYLIPKEMVRSALRINDSIRSINSSLSGLPGQITLLTPVESTGNLKRFFERVTDEASLEPGVENIRVHLDKCDLRDSGSSKPIPWNKVHDEPLNKPVEPLPKGDKKPTKSTRSVVKESLGLDDIVL